MAGEDKIISGALTLIAPELAASSGGAASGGEQVKSFIKIASKVKTAAQNFLKKRKAKIAARRAKQDQTIRQLDAAIGEIPSRPIGTGDGIDNPIKESASVLMQEVGDIQQKASEDGIIRGKSGGMGSAIWIAAGAVILLILFGKKS